MAKNNIKVSANVADTAPAGVAAGAKQHPAWNALRTVAARQRRPTAMRRRLSARGNLRDGHR
jgi:hypothetical protein